jgi:uncharacterized membrane protein
MTPTPPPNPQRTRAMGRVRNYLLTGLLVLAPSAITIWILFRLLNWVDNLLGQYFRFAALDYHRIPGLGLLATLLVLLLVGWIASWIVSKPLLRMWDTLLMRIPGIGIVYGSTKSLGEAFLDKKSTPFKQVVLVPWPHPGMWRIGFITGRAPVELRSTLGEDVEVVFVPHSPNPASGFVHYVPRGQIVHLDWPVEDGLKVIVSGGVAQPGDTPEEALAAARTIEALPGPSAPRS